MKFSHIVACDNNGAIGILNAIPWKVKSDMDWFKKHTLGKICIVGNDTFRSIGKPLPHRRMIVLTHTHIDEFGTLPFFKDLNVTYVSSMDEAIAVANKMAHPLDTEVMIIGGQQIYRQSAPYIDRIYYTEINAEFIEADAFYPVDIKNYRFDNTTIRNRSGISKVNEYDATYYIIDTKDIK